MDKTSVCIVGLGLLGGSYAMALSRKGHSVTAIDRDPAAIAYGLDRGLIQKGATADYAPLLQAAGLVVLCLYPHSILPWLSENQNLLSPGCLLTDVCGVKGGIVEEAQALLRRDVEFVPAHPMAGRERGGFTASTDDLYVGASMILTPDKRTDMRLLETLKDFFLDLGFAGLTFSTPEEHDRIIAFTSQLAHIVSSAYVKSPEAQRRRGFSAGSFQDMTRVARLDEDMWTELFLDDEDFLTKELDELIGHLTDYRDALQSKDAQRLHDLLKEGREKKATAGGN